MNNSYIQQGFNVYAEDRVIIHEDIGRLTLEAGLGAMCGLELDDFNSKWNVNKYQSLSQRDTGLSPQVHEGPPTRKCNS